MTPPIRQLADLPAASDEDEVPPELARIIVALAERQARKDFAARSPEPASRPELGGRDHSWADVGSAYLNHEGTK